MDRMLVAAVFDDADKAIAGRTELLQLEGDGRLHVYANAVLAKHADGTVTLERASSEVGIESVVGGSLGSLIGLLGGPAGAAVGAYAGLAAGAAADLDAARIDDAFVDEVSRTLSPGKFALVAEIDEDWNSLLDARMEELGGVVSRRSISEMRQSIRHPE
jgi:uncharacterized membrane protein